MSIRFSLGSTRFMKVARVDHAEGPSVLKVFILQDPSFSIDLYRDQVLTSFFSFLCKYVIFFPTFEFSYLQVIQIRDLLCNAYNCCPFRRVYVSNNDKCIIILHLFPCTEFNKNITKSNFVFFYVDRLCIS